MQVHVLWKRKTKAASEVCQKVEINSGGGELMMRIIVRRVTPELTHIFFNLDRTMVTSRQRDEKIENICIFLSAGKCWAFVGCSGASLSLVKYSKVENIGTQSLDEFPRSQDCNVNTHFWGYIRRVEGEWLISHPKTKKFLIFLLQGAN